MARTWLTLGYAGILVSGWGIVTIFQGLLNLGRLDAAIMSVHALAKAEQDYAELQHDRGYACTLPELVASGLITDEAIRVLARRGRSEGYVFEIHRCAPNTGQKPNLTYQIVARSLHDGPTVCVDQSGIVRYEPECGQ
jgi:hypothetical protein